MRDIKFRAWDKEKRIWISNGEIEYSISENTLTVIPNTIEHIGDSVHDNYVAERFAVVQYTGLKDKNGVEIYEGDIIDFDVFLGGGVSTLLKVVYSAPSFKVVGISFQTNFVGTSSRIKFMDGEINPGDLEVYEVIGNIYENPELLKEGK